MTYGNYPDLSKVKKILVVKLRHHGDVLLTSPVFSYLKKALPEVCVDAYIYKDTLPMLQGHPGINQFFLYDKSLKKKSLFARLKHEWDLISKIKNEKYDLVINLTEGDRGAMTALLSKSPYRLGFDRQGRRVLGKKNVYSHVIKHCPSQRHTVEKQLDALRCIGLFPSTEDRDLFLHIPDEARENVKNLLPISGEYVVIHPVSRWRFKCLPAQTISAVIEDILNKGFKVVLTSGPDKIELEIIKNIKNLSPKQGVIDLSGQTTLKELSALIADAKLLLCVDSVPLHIASAVKTPLVVVFGPTSEQNWGPWMHAKSKVVTKNFPCRPCFRDGCAGSKMSDCLYSLEVKSIIKAIDEII